MGTHLHTKYSIFDKFTDLIDWSSLDGYTVGGAVGYNVNPYGATLHAQSHIDDTDDVFLNSLWPWRKLLDAGKVITVEFDLSFMSKVTAQTIWVLFSESHDDPPTETDDHFGWKIINADLNATSADGATQEITDTGINISTGGQRTRLKIVVTPGTDVKFYVNDVLEVTSSTNIPAATDYHFHIYAVTAENDDVRFGIGRVLIEKEHA